MAIDTDKLAKKTAAELYKLMKPDILEVAKGVAQAEAEEFIGLKEAACLIGMSPSTLYKKKNDIGCWHKVGGRITFAKRKLVARYASMC